MKRSKYLTPLSWEHHSALLNANRLQKGLENQTTEEILLDFLTYIWQNDLHPHFQREESIVFTGEDWTNLPADLRKQVLDEHRLLSDLFNQITSTAKEKDLKSLLALFAQNVIDHVRFEERLLFPKIEETYKENQLQKIGVELKKAHVPGCVVWTPKFWEKKI